MSRALRTLHLHSWSKWSDPAVLKQTLGVKDGAGAWQQIPCDLFIQKRKCEVCGYAQQREVKYP